MNDSTRWKVDGSIAKRLKLLIWSKNTYKHKEKKIRRGVKAKSTQNRKKRGGGNISASYICQDIKD
jgi:hypothetical protein